MKLEFIDNVEELAIRLEHINCSNWNKIPEGAIVLINIDNPALPDFPWRDDFEFPDEGIDIRATLISHTIRDAIPTIELEFEHGVIAGHSGSDYNNTEIHNRYFVYIDPTHNTLYT